MEQLCFFPSCVRHYIYTSMSCKYQNVDTFADTCYYGVFLFLSTVFFLSFYHVYFVLALFQTFKSLKSYLLPHLSCRWSVNLHLRVTVHLLFIPHIRFNDYAVLVTSQICFSLRFRGACNVLVYLLFFSFSSCVYQSWLTEIHEYAQQDVVLMLLGNKVKRQQ